MERTITLQGLLLRLHQLPDDTKVTMHVFEDSSFTVLVDSAGEARIVRNTDKDKRWFLFELPENLMSDTLPNRKPPSHAVLRHRRR